MCKLFAIVEVENQANAEMFAKKAIPEITKVDNHGLGIMRLGENGVHIQRWLTPPTVVRKKKSKHLAKYASALKHQENEEGKASKNLYALAVHGRFATCEKSLTNTHPFYKDGTALMHNGIISNASKFPRTLSTCDSEALLSQYLVHDVRTNAGNLTKSLDGVAGYYAAIVFNDNGIIDIYRDETATLFLAHVQNVGVVIATTAEIILSAAKKCKAYVTGLDEILPFTAIRWDKGVYPQIATFESNEPAYVPSHVFGKDLKDLDNEDVFKWHRQNSSDAGDFQTSDVYDEHWWNIEDQDMREAARIAEWKASEEADALALEEKLYDMRRREEASKLKKAV